MSYQDGPVEHFGARSSPRTPAADRITEDIERARSSPHLRDHLSESERIRVGTRQHRVVLLKPTLAVITSFVLLLRSLTDTSTLSTTREFFLIAFLGTAVWLAVRWLQWSRHFFLATDDRVLKMYGVLSTTVDSMKVQKVTDMKYHRSFLGEILGYANITIESAGQDQALHDVSYIPYPRENYQELCHIILGEDPRSGGAKQHRFRRRLELITRRGRGPAAAEIGYPDGLTDDVDEERVDPAPRVLYSSTDVRMADTAPIPIYPPGYFAGRDDDDADEDWHDDPTRP